MIDTHSHIYLTEDFPEGESSLAVERGLEAGVQHIILPGVNAQTLPPMFELHDKYPANTSVAVGLHPSDVGADWESELDEILAFADRPGVVAIGEVGLDYHEDVTFREQQLRAFRKQIREAHARNLSLIIHQREALADTIALLKEAEAEGVMPEHMVFHCFTGTPEEAAQLIEAFPGAMFGIGGVATFKNAASVREAVRLIGIDRIVLETDAPWLAPVPRRGKRNESAYIPHIATSVADTLGLQLSDVITATDANARRLFPGMK